MKQRTSAWHAVNTGSLSCCVNNYRKHAGGAGKVRAQRLMGEAWSAGAWGGKRKERNAALNVVG